MVRGVKIGYIYIYPKKFISSIKEDFESEKELKNKKFINLGVKTLSITGRHIDLASEFERLIMYIDPPEEYNMTRRYNPKTKKRELMEVVVPDVVKKQLLFEHGEWNDIETFDIRFSIDSVKYPGLHAIIRTLNGGTKGKDEFCQRYAVPEFQELFRYKERNFKLEKQGFTITNYYMNIYKPATKWRETIKMLKKIKSPYIRFEFTEDTRNRTKLKKHFIINKIKT